MLLVHEHRSAASQGTIQLLVKNCNQEVLLEIWPMYLHDSDMSPSATESSIAREYKGVQQLHKYCR